MAVTTSRLRFSFDCRFSKADIKTDPKTDKDRSISP